MTNFRVNDEVKWIYSPEKGAESGRSDYVGIVTELYEPNGLLGAGIRVNWKIMGEDDLYAVNYRTESGIEHVGLHSRPIEVGDPVKILNVYEDEVVPQVDGTFGTLVAIDRTNPLPFTVRADSDGGHPWHCVSVEHASLSVQYGSEVKEDVVNDVKQEFEPGDKIRVIREYPTNDAAAEWAARDTMLDGKTGTFVGYRNSPRFPFEVEIDGEYGHEIVFSIEKVRAFEKGDRVRVTRVYAEEVNETELTEQLLGKIGTFQYNDGSNSIPIQVHFERGEVADGYEGTWYVQEVEHVSETTDSEESSMTDREQTAETNMELIDRNAELAAEVTEVRTLLARANEQVSDRDERITRLMNAASERAAEMNAFRRQVFDLAKEKNEEGDICDEGFRDAMIELGLDEFLDDDFEVVVTLRLSAEQIREAGISKTDDVDDSKLAELIYNLDRTTLYYGIEGYETEDN